MKHIIGILIILFSVISCNAQNLVPNGDFEQHTHCPTGISQLDTATFWITPTSGTSDYFNQCDVGNAGVPDNTLGFQQAYNGMGYAGIHRYGNGSNYREYMEVQLDSSLRAGVCYNFEMRINLSNKSQFTTPEIGAYLSNTFITGVNNTLPLPYTPQINNTAGNSPDTLNWTLVTGSFIATGGERFLIIGNFKDDAATSPSVTTYNPTAIAPLSYTYVDAVSLKPCAPENVQEEEKLLVRIFPNPASTELHIQLDDYKFSQITIYDITSRKLLQQNFVNAATIDVREFANGIYFYEVTNETSTVQTGKFVKQ